ncbi:hypothetical protein M2168_001519 [Streptomyces sp. CZ24]|nr:hypothetical protein [Streptomyces sp. CZ24]
MTSAPTASLATAQRSLGDPGRRYPLWPPLTRLPGDQHGGGELPGRGGVRVRPGARGPLRRAAAARRSRPVGAAPPAARRPGARRGRGPAGGAGARGVRQGRVPRPPHAATRTGSTGARSAPPWGPGRPADRLRTGRRRAPHRGPAPGVAGRLGGGRSHGGVRHRLPGGRLPGCGRGAGARGPLGSGHRRAGAGGAGGTGPGGAGAEPSAAVGPAGLRAASREEFDGPVACFPTSAGFKDRGAGRGPREAPVAEWEAARARLPAAGLQE